MLVDVKRGRREKEERRGQMVNGRNFNRKERREHKEGRGN
jgi:hypothetical protein